MHFSAHNKTGRKTDSWMKKFVNGKGFVYVNKTTKVMFLPCLAMRGYPCISKGKSFFYKVNTQIMLASSGNFILENSKVSEKV